MSKIRANLKTIIVLVILVLVGVLGVLGLSTAKTLISGASADTGPKEGSLVTTPGETETVITWTTNKEVVSGVKYGLSPASLLLTAYDEVSGDDKFTPTSDHRVTVKTKPGTVYHFVVVNYKQSGSSKEETEVFDNGGIPYSFMTKGSKKTTVASPTPLPTNTMIAVPTTAVVNCEGLNSFEKRNCLKAKGSGAVVSPTPAVNCDTNGDGVTNSFEKSRCLQKP